MALSALPFAASGVLVGADNRAVNQMQRSQRLFRQCPEYPQPHAFLGPSVEAVIDRRVGPYRSGRARHGEPVRKMEKMPLRTRRSSWRGTPRGLFGNTGAMIPNSTFAKSNRAIVQASVVWKLESQVTLSRKPPLWVQKIAGPWAKAGAVAWQSDCNNSAPTEVKSTSELAKRAVSRQSDWPRRCRISSAIWFMAEKAAERSVWGAPVPNRSR